jgi:glycosyltransferase involved in cell wall biosynthesis
MVLLEAMAAGLPIVCSNSGGGAEVVKGVGTIFRMGNSEDLANTLISISQEKKNISKASVRLAKHFSDCSAKINFFNLTFIKKIML